jgi:ribosomal RNA assembly protein
MKYLKMPMERIGVLIGRNGETKKDLEEKSGIKINIDSKTGDINFDENNFVDPLMILKVENIINAISKGFSPEKAFLLFSDESDFFTFDLKDYAGKSDTQIRRLKSRVIGTEGKTRRVLEDLTNSKVSVHGHNVSIISDITRMNILKKSIDMLLTGSKHATIYRFVEAQMKELKRSERLGF